MFYKTFAMITFLSLKCFPVFFSMELLIGYLKTLPLEMGGGVRWVRVHTQWGHSKRTYVYNGGEVKFLPFGAYVLNE